MPLSIPGPQGPAGASGGGAIAVKMWLTRDYLYGDALVDQSGALTLNTTHGLFAAYAIGGGSFAEGDLVMIEDRPLAPTGNGGLYVLGSMTDPAAVPLTRHASYPSASTPVPSGTIFESALAFPQDIVHSFAAAAVDAGADAINIGFFRADYRVMDQGTLVVLFPHNGSALPGGLSEGVAYTLVGTTREPRPEAVAYYDLTFQLSTDPDTFAPEDITSGGTDSADDSYAAFAHFVVEPYDFPAKARFRILGDAITVGGLDGNAYSRADRSISGIALADDFPVYGTSPTPTTAGEASIAEGAAAVAKGNGVALGSNAQAINGGLSVGQGSFGARSAVALGQQAKAFGAGSLAVGAVKTFNNGEIAVAARGPHPGSFFGPSSHRAIVFGGTNESGTPETLYGATQLGQPFDDGDQKGVKLELATAFVFTGQAIATNGSSGTDQAFWFVKGMFVLSADGVMRAEGTFERFAHTPGEAADYALAFSANTTDVRFDCTADVPANVAVHVRLEGLSYDTYDYGQLTFPSAALVLG